MGYGTGAHIMAVPGHDERGLRVRQDLRAFPSGARRGPALSPRADTPLDAARAGGRGGRGQLEEPRSRARRHADERQAKEVDHRVGPQPRVVWGGRRSTTSSATGSSAASATGASRSRSCSTRNDPAPMAVAGVGSARPAPRPGPTSAPKAAGPSAAARQGDRVGSISPTSTAARPNTMPQWAGSCWVLPSATSTRRTTSASCRPPSSKDTGCRSTSTSAGPSTRSCTCSIAGSGTRLLFDRGQPQHP